MRVALARAVAAGSWPRRGVCLRAERAVAPAGRRGRSLAQPGRSDRRVARRLAGRAWAPPVAATALFCVRASALGIPARPNSSAACICAPTTWPAAWPRCAERLAHLPRAAGHRARHGVRARRLAAADAQRAAALWDAAALNAHYRDGTARLSAWLETPALPLERAARESFELGHAAIRSLVFDPLLPAPLVDAAARSRFIKTVARFDDAGKAVWQRFLKRVRAAAPARPGFPSRILPCPRGDDR